MSRVKETEIYPKFEFRLDHHEKEWLQNEIEVLKKKFNEPHGPVVTKNVVILAALRHGIRYLKKRKPLSTATGG